MVKFLKFVRADLTESERDFKDAYVKKLQESIRHVKESREMEELGPVSDKVREKIMTEKSLETLKKWHKLAAKAESMEEFLKAM